MIPFLRRVFVVVVPAIAVAVIYFIYVVVVSNFSLSIGTRKDSINSISDIPRLIVILKIKHAERRVFRSFSTRRRENDFGEEKRKQSVVFLSLSLSNAQQHQHQYKVTWKEILICIVVTALLKKYFAKST